MPSRFTHGAAASLYPTETTALPLEEPSARTPHRVRYKATGSAAFPRRWSCVPARQIHAGPHDMNDEFNDFFLKTGIGVSGVPIGFSRLSGRRVLGFAKS